MTRNLPAVSGRALTLSAHILAIAALSLSASAFAVVPDQPIPDIPLIHRPGVGARAMGMGGAVSASVGEYTAMHSNPAVLALVRSTQITGSMEHRTLDRDDTYLGHRSGTSLSETRLHSLGFAYPYPTYRGSLVIGLGYDVVAPFGSDYFRTASNRGSVDFERETILENGMLGTWSAGFAVDVSPRVSLGAAGIILTGDSRREREFMFDHANGLDWEITSAVTDMDITGVSGRLGALVRTDSGINLGLVLHLPERLNLSGTAFEDVRRYDSAGDTLDYEDRFDFDESLTLPFRMTGALAYMAMLGPGDLTLGGEATFADWKEIDYAGRIRARGLGYAYRSTVDLRLGAEYAFMRPLPVSLRAGFASLPLAYRPIKVDVFRNDYELASIGRDRRAWTLGLGVQVDPTLRIDLAYVRSSYERSGRSTAGAVTEESAQESRLLMGVLLEL